MFRVAPLFQSSAKRMVSYSLRQIGAANSLDYRLYLEKDGKPASFFHDVPLESKTVASSSSNKSTSNQRVFNMVVEIPRWTNAKAEIGTKLLLNPIIVDSKKGKPRFVKNLFPYKGYIWNYGALPQTWEDPNHIDTDTKAKGDNDPVDVIEIGNRTGYPGQIKQVKILGTLALLDEGETDWKMIAIDLADPRAASVNDIADVEKQFPGLLQATVHWFRHYKQPDGKPVNEFAFEGRAQNADYALKVIDDTHAYWRNLVGLGNTKTDAGGLAVTNTTLPDSPHHNPKAADQIPAAQPAAPAPYPDTLDESFFLGSKL